MPKRKRTAECAVSKVGETFELVDDNNVNILAGLVLHNDVITKAQEDELISFVQSQCERGRSGQLRKPTYLRSSGARSRGNQREALQYGGFFDFNKARPGKRGQVPEFPPILVKLVTHLMDKGYLPHDVKPDSCIINQYGEGDCIPPHVDHESYERPISTLSLLGEEAMLLGTKFKTVKNCTWKPIVGQSVLLPRRSLLVLGGNSGNISKHCISACTRRRISITLRKQPPPDWVPRSNYLAKSVEIKSGAKKPLSGSAKRRKKMMKQRGIITQDDGAPQRQVHPTIEDAKPASKKERKSEKQARRNARRRAKKQQAAIET